LKPFELLEKTMKLDNRRSKKSSRRPTSLIGLLWAAVRLFPSSALWAWGGALLIAVLLGVFWWAWPSQSLRVGTFNIEFYPKSERQAENAFALIRSLRLKILAVQEITQPQHFAQKAAEKLGKEWKFVSGPKEGPFHLGVLYNSNEFRVRSTKTRPTLNVGNGTRAGFEVHLAPKWGGETLRVLVVHLAATNEKRNIRIMQFRALRGILKEMRSSPEQLVVLGDFNATSKGDRDDLAALAKQFNLDWSTEPLRCTSYWNRPEECLGSSLDHVLSSQKPRRTKAEGACASRGCGPWKACPIEFHQISDHCPVVLTY
jgi:endonuclease/exonuclease/phosphatase family metal-dependent hydrolase